MDLIEPPNWTLGDHMTAGIAAISLMQRDFRYKKPQPICHHFDEYKPVDPMQISVEATYRHLCETFSELELEFLPDRLEAWETTRPTEMWLNERVPTIFASANASGLIYRGWSWEPVDGQPITASEVQIFNNRTE